MNFFLKLMSSGYTRRVSENGMGPFLPSTLKSFLQGRCCECEREISDLQIFGNAFVLEDDLIKLKCTKCRIGNAIPVNDIKVFRSVINRRYVLVEMNEMLKKGKNDFLDIFLGLKDFAGLQHTETYENTFNVNYEPKPIKYLLDLPNCVYPDRPRYLEPIQNTFGHIVKLKFCGECGVFLHVENHPDVEKTGKCWACQLPNEFQWNMRISFKELQARLKKYDYMLPDRKGSAH